MITYTVVDDFDGKRFAGIEDGSTAFSAAELCDRLNDMKVKIEKLQAVADAVGPYILDPSVTSFRSLTKARDALNARTKEQLLRELFEAGDDLCQADGREHSDMVEKYRAAERAYEAAE